MRKVKELTFDLLRRLGLTIIVGNPGATEETLQNSSVESATRNRILEPIPLHLAPQRHPVNSQNLCRRGLIAVRLLQNPADIFFFIVLQGEEIPL